MKKIKISTRLIGAFFIVALVGAALGLFAIANMSKLDQADTSLYEHEALGLSWVKEANVQRYAAVVAARDAIIATTPADREGALKRMDAWRAKSLELLNEVRKQNTDADNRAAFRKVDEARKADQQSLEGVLKVLADAPLQPDSPVLQYLRGNVVQPSIRVGGAMPELTKQFEANAKNFSYDNTVLYQISRNITLGLILLGVLVGVGLWGRPVPPGQLACATAPLVAAS